MLLPVIISVGTSAGANLVRPHLLFGMQSCEIASRAKHRNSGKFINRIVLPVTELQSGFKHLSQVTKVNMFLEPRGN